MSEPTRAEQLAIDILHADDLESSIAIFKELCQEDLNAAMAFGKFLSYTQPENMFAWGAAWLNATVEERLIAPADTADAADRFLREQE